MPSIPTFFKFLTSKPATQALPRAVTDLRATDTITEQVFINQVSAYLELLWPVFVAQ